VIADPEPFEHWKAEVFSVIRGLSLGDRIG